MKNNIFTFMLIVATSAAFAQVPRGFSVAAGVNQTNWDSKDLLADGGLGYKVGIGFNFGYHETYNYEFDIMLEQQSLKLYSLDYDNTTVQKVKASMQTIGISAQFNYYVIKPDEDKFYLGGLLGIKANFGGGDMSSKEAGDFKYLPYKVENSELTNVAKISAAPIVGVVAGYNKFRLAVKYDIGLTNILRDVQAGQIDGNGNYTGPALEGKMSAASVVLYYKVF